jgi:hypothetical protein
MISFVRIYRDEVGDGIFESYLGMANSRHIEEEESDEGEYVMFYTIDVNSIPSEYLVED